MGRTRAYIPHRTKIIYTYYYFRSPNRSNAIEPHLPPPPFVSGGGATHRRGFIIHRSASESPIPSMATATAVPATCGLGEVLVDGYAYIAHKLNHTTAVGLTRRMEIIVASFWSERPPLPSRLYVHSPELESSAFSQLPRILCVVEGLILFRVAIRCREPILYEDCDYFIYRVDSASLELIPNPSPLSLRDEDIGLLPRGNHYTVAALVPTSDPRVFTLHLLQSESGRWTSKDVSLETPQSEFPMQISRDSNACRLLSHTTGTVITLGGEDGTMGWVDLWRGVLLCDVLLPAPKLRGVPLPLPRAMFLPDGESRIDFRGPELYRGIAFSKEKRCLMFVDLDIIYQRLPASDKRGIPTFRFDGWMITRWSNCNLSNSFQDWKIDCPPVHADDIKLNEQVQKQMLEYQLLRPKAPLQGNSVAAVPGRKLENLFVFLPTPSVDDSNVVFLIAKAEFLQPETHVLEVDMGNRQLKGVAEFGTERDPCACVIRCHGTVSQV